MSPDDGGAARKLTIDPDLFMLVGGTKRDRRRLLDRAERAEREGLVTIVDLVPTTGRGDSPSGGPPKRRSKEPLR